MRRRDELPIGNECFLRLVVNEPTFVVGRIFQVIGAYREKGFLCAYIQPADVETYYEHWRAECCISKSAFSSDMPREIGCQLLSATACTEPLFVNICFTESVQDWFETFGSVLQDDGDD